MEWAVNVQQRRTQGPYPEKVIELVELSATHARSRVLLDAYFEERRATFPPTQGAYRKTYPNGAEFTAPDGAFLLVVEADEDLGCGGVRRLTNATTTSRRFEVKHLWIRPDVRGRGLGRMLLHALEQRAIELHAEEIVLDTNESLEAAGGLYRSSGYREIAAYNVNPNATHWYAKTVDDGGSVLGNER